MKSKRIAVKLIMVISCVATLLGIGYAQISAIQLSIEGDASLPRQEGVIISNISYSSSSPVSSTYTVRTYYGSMLSTTVDLPTTVSDPNNPPYVTLTITIMNLTNSYQIYDGIVYDTNPSFYSNSNIVPTTTGITENATILNPAGTTGDEITFNVTFSYLDIQNISSGSLSSMISFHFTPMISISFQGCTNAAGQTSQLIRTASVTNNAGNTYHPTVDLETSPPSSITIQNTDQTVTLTENTDYTYANGIVTFLNTISEEYVIKSNASSGTIFSTYITNLLQNITADSNGVYTAPSDDASCTNTFVYDGTTENNLRYVGATPCNYVYFNCDNSGQNCELWRVIGVMNDADTTASIKMVKDALSFSGTQWNSTTSSDWLTSSLYNTLNTTYYASLNSHSAALIQNTKWNTGAQSGNTKTTTFYTSEHGTKSASAFKVGLFSPSDYGHATSGGGNRSNCISANLTNYSTTCRNNNWFYNSNSYQWTITPRSGTNYVYYITTNGQASTATVTSNSTYYNLRPCVYLNADARIVSGDGSTNHPYEFYYSTS